MIHRHEKMKEIALVIPVYNHANEVGRVIEGCLSLEVPIYVVDDGSTDDSYKVASRYHGVIVLRHDRNLGKGAALLTGFSAASKVARWAATIDADGQHDPADSIQLLKSISPHQRPIVLGRRVGMEGGNVPWTSRFGRGFSNFWVWMAGGRIVFDSQSGFRIYPLPEILTLKTKARRFQFEVEILVIACWNRFPILEVPVSVSYQAEDLRVSHFRPFVDFWRNAFTFTRLIAMRILIPRPIRVRIFTRLSR
ncbi:glycosyltransferase family 2 protein [Thermodesulfobacteriota bacterium]